MHDRIFVGVLRLGVSIPGARSLKDRRQAIASLRDRIRHRFEVTFHEIDTSDRPTWQVLALTTAGNAQAPIRSTMDQIVAFVARDGRVGLADVDVDVFRWHPLDRLPRVGSETEE